MAITTAPPRILTIEEYRTRWQPQGWELIIIGPTSTWRQEWGEWEAIRDIVQNALDESEYYQWGYDEQGLYIRDVGRGIAVADFLLGPPKAKPDWARGKFGEGMKIASLALLRKGYHVYIETVGREIWVIFFQQKVDGGVDTLAALWRPGGRRHGTVFHIIGYRGPAFERYFAVNLPRPLILWETPSTMATPIRRYNQLIRAEGMAASPAGGMIYARDIYLRDIKSQFSYNLWGFELAPDRHGPRNETDVWVDIGRLWCGVSRVDLLERFLKMVCAPPQIEAEESHNVSMDSYSMGTDTVSGKRYADFIKDNASLWQTAWRNVFGDNAVIRTSDRLDGTVKHLDYAPVSIQWYVRDTLARAITTDEELVSASQQRLREVETIPDERLTPRQAAHLRLARKIVTYFHYPVIAGVYAAIIPPASDRVRTAGMYSRTTREIYIASDQLERGRSTIDTVIHEIAHHTSGAEDLEEGHSREMTHVAARVVELTAAGSFDGEKGGRVVKSKWEFPQAQTSQRYEEPSPEDRMALPFTCSQCPACQHAFELRITDVGQDDQLAKFLKVVRQSVYQSEVARVNRLLEDRG